MALVERFHVVAAERTVATGATITEGMIVALDASGYVCKQGAADGIDTFKNIPYGIAGDTKSTSASGMPGVASGWQNRVSDYFDETKASSKMTVYHSGGEFATDQYTSGVASLAAGAPLYAENGIFRESETQTSGIVARLIKTADYYPSGVPGVDINGDQALAANGPSSNTTRYIEIKLVI